MTENTKLIRCGQVCIVLGAALGGAICLGLFVVGGVFLIEATVNALNKI